jgi:hypothetical protein
MFLKPLHAVCASWPVSVWILPESFHDVLAMMAEALHDTVQAREIARNFRCLPEQLLECVKQVMINDLTGRNIIQANGPANRGRIASECALPVPVAEHGNGRSARLVVGSVECAAKRRSDAQGVKKFSGD